jgi:hypothetical protein
VFWRRRLPHWVPDDSIVFITLRLASTLPQPKLKLLTGDPNPGRAFPLKDRQLDRMDTGPRWLTSPHVADLFVEALAYGERARHEYDLFAWMVMSNHVHLVLKPNGKLSEVMRWLNAATANRANRMLGKTGEAFWQRILRPLDSVEQRACFGGGVCGGESCKGWLGALSGRLALVERWERHRRPDRRRYRIARNRSGNVETPGTG